MIRNITARATTCLIRILRLLTAVFLFAIVTLTPVSFAKYEGIFSTKVCNGYPVYVGTVSRMNSTTGYDGYENTWVEIIDAYGNRHGGKFYFRQPAEAAYTPMVNNARLALVTGITVKACINGDDVYALEIYKL